MIIAWTPNAWEECQHWKKHDRKLLKRVNELIKDCTRTPFQGRGKPESLRHDLAGYWSRRINAEHRLVYKYVSETDTLTIIQCRFHY